MAAAAHQQALDRAAQAPAPRTLIDILRATTARIPEASALDDGSGALSYRELMARVGQTAARLHEAGVRRGDRVGVRVASGSKELYLSILGILAVGAAYVPVDADDPDERARLVFGEARVAGVITGEGRVRRRAIAGCRARTVSSTAATRIPSTHAIEVVPPPTVDHDAWIIFTSGSTGVPKGVAVSHRSAAAFVDAEARLFLQDAPLGPGDRVLAGLSVAFDASCEEMWLAWRHGACLVPAPRSLVRSGEDLAPWLIRQSITVVSTVPTLAAMWPSDSDRERAAAHLRRRGVPAGARGTTRRGRTRGLEHLRSDRGDRRRVRRAPRRLDARADRAAARRLGARGRRRGRRARSPRAGSAS